MPSFFCGCLNSRIKIQKHLIFTEKNEVTLNITRVKDATNFQIIPFMVQNKTQIASNTHRYKKIVKKIHESQIINTSLYISKTVTCNIFDKKLIYKEN